MKTYSFSKTYDGTTVLTVPSLELQHGKLYSIIGSNGSGKSTFAKILAGIIPADQKGRQLETDISVGYMPQKNYAFRMSTKANILSASRDEKKAEALMDALQISALASKRADRLSGGETARMTLARLMMKQFDLVILDEPTADMDMKTTLLAEELILQYTQKTDCALILITHSLQQASRIADELFFFHQGQLWEAGAKESLLHNPVRPETKSFLEFYGVPFISSTAASFKSGAK